MFSIHAMGNLMRQLNQVRMGFFALRRLARDLGTEFEETGRRGTNSMRNIEAVIRQNAMMAFGQMTTMLGQRVNRRIFEFGQGFLEAGANMESVRVQFEQIFGSDQASDRLNETLRLASLTILDTDQALEGVARFSRMGADVLSDAFQVNVGTIDQPVMRAVSGLQLISDLVIATGQTQENVMFNMAGAIRGQTRSWRGLFDGMVDAEEEGFNQAATAGERAQIILGTIAREFGGISARAEGTMQFMLRNLRDILRSIQMIVGERLLGVFRPLVERLTVLLRAFRENEQFIEAFTFVIQGPMRILASIGGKILDMVEAVERFIVQRPRLARLVATFATIVPIVLIVVGSMATLAASFSFFTVFVLPGLMAFLGSIGGSFMLLIGPLRWLVLAFAALVAAYRHNLGGFRDWVEASAPDEVHFQMDRIFNFMPLIFRSDRGQDMQATYLFTMEGDGGGQWAIQIAGGKAESLDGAPTSFDTEVKTKPELWIDLSTNDLNPMWAITTRKVQLGGNAGLAMKLGQLFQVSP